MTWKTNNLTASQEKEKRKKVNVCFWNAVKVFYDMRLFVITLIAMTYSMANKSGLFPQLKKVSK